VAGHDPQIRCVTPDSGDAVIERVQVAESIRILFVGLHPVQVTAQLFSQAQDP